MSGEIQEVTGTPDQTDSQSGGSTLAWETQKWMHERLSHIFDPLPNNPGTKGNGAPENITMRQLGILSALRNVMGDSRNANGEILSPAWYGRLEAGLLEGRFSHFRIAETPEGGYRVHADMDNKLDHVFFSADGDVLGGFVSE